MKHPAIVEWWRHKAVDSMAWWKKEAEKTAKIDPAAAQRQLDQIAAYQAAETLSYRRAYIELGAIALLVVAVVVWNLV